MEQNGFLLARESRRQTIISSRGHTMAETDYEVELDRLWESPILVSAETDLMGASIQLMDGPSFVSQYREIVVLEIYDFDFEGDRPTIIDGGANIGVACLWWLARWPKAKVIAFEPDPKIFDALRHNLRHYSSPELHCSALSTSKLGSKFVVQGSDGGRLELSAVHSDDTLTVRTDDLGEAIDRLGHVDLLKLDIEGAETEVLLDAETHLWQVERVFVEYHSFVGQAQSLPDLLSLLRRQGFRVHLTTPVAAVRPFRTVPSAIGMDLQCNIWAWRDATAESASEGQADAR
ncbi:FkbM family methyltransferase [Cryobacterium sp. Hh11]|uniref:FkbM family methyltransferase n=1 Tax=Cryobacterium sp. Hh11 TaxID=2555868 RepID=UPI00106A2AE6|nr:FkbM family methyltransferase [Cryobacterium sp. Hh11]TFD54768.1 FkbM family methyltransferase [Cryobacterium sp. Hh11]